MIITTGTEDGRRLVTLTEVPRAYTHHLVRGLDFTRDGGTFTWEYPAAAPGWEDAAHNWERDGAEMLDQAHRVRPPDWEAGLAWIAPILDAQDADWFVIGSAAMAVRGLDVSPGNLDLAMDEASADRLMPLVAGGVLRPIVDRGDWPVATRTGDLFHGCGISLVVGMKEQPGRPTLLGRRGPADAGHGGVARPRGQSALDPAPAPLRPHDVPQRPRAGSTPSSRRHPDAAGR